jgi:DNA mismatch repair protein MutS2
VMERAEHLGAAIPNAPSADGDETQEELPAGELPSPGGAVSRPRRRTERPERLAWQIGDRARSRSGGWEGRIASIDRGRRATLEAGAIRVSVELADLEPVDPSTPERGSGRASAGAGAGVGAGGGGTNVEALRLGRTRAVPLSLDLRGARVDEALAGLDRYLDDASVSGLGQVTVIHGLGTGALRDAVRSASAAHPLVKSVRPGERGEGGDGATIVTLG